MDLSDEQERGVLGEALHSDIKAIREGVEMLLADVPAIKSDVTQVKADMTELKADMKLVKQGVTQHMLTKEPHPAATEQ